MEIPSRAVRLQIEVAANIPVTRNGWVGALKAWPIRAVAP